MSKIPGNPVEKQKYLEGLNGNEFVYLIGDILSIHFKHTNIKIVDGPGDGKRDIFSLNTNGEKHITQCKYHKNSAKTCGSKETDEIVIALNKFGYQVGTFCTSGKISPQSKREYLDNYPEYDLQWLEYSELVDIILGNSLLKKIWFDGAKIHLLSNSISIPFILREMPNDISIHPKTLSIDLDLPEDIIFSIEKSLYKRSQFRPYRELGKNSTENFFGSIHAFEIKLTGNINLSTLRDIKTQLVKRIKKNFNIKYDESYIAVRFGIPYFNDFSEKENNFDTNKFNLPERCETIIISANDNVDEKSWFYLLDKVWKLPDRCHMSQISNFCYYNIEFDFCLHIFYTCLLEKENNMHTEVQIEVEKILWKKSLFLSSDSKEMDLFLDQLGELLPHKLYSFGPNGQLACWLHPHPTLYSYNLKTFEQNLYYEEFEKEKSKIMKVSKKFNVEKIHWNIASKVAAINEEDPFPENKETVLRMVDFIEQYHNIPSPLDPGKRTLVFECVWATKAINECEFNNKIELFIADVNEIHLEYNLKFTIDEGMEFFYLGITWEPKYQIHLSTQNNIINSIYIARDIFNELEKALKNILPKTKRFTNRYWFEELGISLDVESLKT